MPRIGIGTEGANQPYEVKFVKINKDQSTNSVESKHLLEGRGVKYYKKGEGLLQKLDYLLKKIFVGFEIKMEGSSEKILVNKKSFLRYLKQDDYTVNVKKNFKDNFYPAIGLKELAQKVNANVFTKAQIKANEMKLRDNERLKAEKQLGQSNEFMKEIESIHFDFNSYTGETEHRFMNAMRSLDENLSYLKQNHPDDQRIQEIQGFVSRTINNISMQMLNTETHTRLFFNLSAIKNDYESTQNMYIAKFVVFLRDGIRGNIDNAHGRINRELQQCVSDLQKLKEKDGNLKNADPDLIKALNNLCANSTVLTRLNALGIIEGRDLLLQVRDLIGT